MKDVWAGLKDAPLWLLGGITIIALLLWRVPTLGHLMPAGYRSWLPLTALAAGILFSTSAMSALLQAQWRARERRQEHCRLRLTKVYRPMVALFGERHMTSASAELAPRLRHRINNAWEAARGRRYLRAKLRGAWRELWDRKISTSAEMDFGQNFPLSEIKSVLKASGEYADGELLSHVRRADRSRYEDMAADTDVTDAEFALAEYIFRRHSELENAVEKAR